MPTGDARRSGASADVGYGPFLGRGGYLAASGGLAGLLLDRSRLIGASTWAFVAAVLGMLLLAHILSHAQGRLREGILAEHRYSRQQTEEHPWRHRDLRVTGEAARWSARRRQSNSFQRRSYLRGAAYVSTVDLAADRTLGWSALACRLAAAALVLIGTYLFFMRWSTGLPLNGSRDGEIASVLSRDGVAEGAREDYLLNPCPKSARQRPRFGSSAE